MTLVASAASAIVSMGALTRGAPVQSPYKPTHHAEEEDYQDLPQGITQDSDACSQSLFPISQSELAEQEEQEGSEVTDHLSRHSTEIVPEEPEPADIIAQLGIKVRDFAYESKLPRIAAYKPASRTLASSAAAGDASSLNKRALKRSRPSYSSTDDVFSSSWVSSTAAVGASGSTSNNEPPPAKRARPLERKTTETVEDTCIPEPESTSSRTTPPINQDIASPYTPHKISSPSQAQSQPQFGYFTSQESEDISTPYVTTPSVTPNGSLQWIASTGDTIMDTSAIPASQLDGSQATLAEPELVSFSQLGMPPPPELLGSQSQAPSQSPGTRPLPHVSTPVRPRGRSGMRASTPLTPTPGAGDKSASAHTSSPAPLISISALEAVSLGPSSSPVRRPSNRTRVPPPPAADTLREPTPRYSLRKRSDPPPMVQIRGRRLSATGAASKTAHETRTAERGAPPRTAVSRSPAKKRRGKSRG
jgi:hypothetical protein